MVDIIEEYFRRKKAQEKYNSSSVNVYMEGNGAPIDGIINVRFYHPEGDPTKTNINIPESLMINDSYEQEAILRVITESPYYSYEEFGSVEFMQAQWTAHNLAFNLSKTGEPWLSLVAWFSSSTDPIESSQTLDIRSKNNMGRKAGSVYIFLEFADNCKYLFI